MDFFISYRRSGGFLFSGKLYTELSTLGFRVFWDIKKMKSGRFDKQICAQLRAASYVIAVCSVGMFTEHRQHDWVAKELLTARSLNKPMIVVVLKGAHMDSIGCPDCLNFLYDLPRIDLNIVTIREAIDRICSIVSGINRESIRQTYFSRSSSDTGGKPAPKAKDRLLLLSCPALQKKSRHAAVTELLCADYGSVPIYIDFQTVPIRDRCYRTGIKNNRIIPGIIASDIRHIPLCSVSDGMKRAVEVTFSRETDEPQYLLVLDHFDCLPQYSVRGFPLADLIAYEIMEMLRACPDLSIAVLLTENELYRYFPASSSGCYHRLQEQEQLDVSALKRILDPAKQSHCGISYGFDGVSVQFILEFIVPLAVQRSGKTGMSNGGYPLTRFVIAECLKALSDPSSTIYSAEARMHFTNYASTDDPRINVASVARRMCMSQKRISTAKRVLDFCRSIGIVSYSNGTLCFISKEVYDYFRSKGELISEWV